ncbi:MAG: T9SS type A sorting domain-containing protein [Saprospiraceae bacterium]
MIKNIKPTYYIILMIIGTHSIYAQQYRKFETGEYEKNILEDDKIKKVLREKEIEFETYFKNEFLLYEKAEIITLPLVFNIVLSSDKVLDYEIIKAQVKILNEAFSNQIKMPKDDYYKDKAVDAEIRFCVPEYSDKYIRRKEISKNTKWTDKNEMKEENGLSPYKPDKFINIWITDVDDAVVEKQKFINGGYAQLPGREEKTDGIVIDVDLFGPRPSQKLYSKGLTLVHLMGTYLGLKPLTGFSPCEGDGVDDTPDSNVDTYDCLPQTEIYYLASGCGWNERRMNHNFMDNVPDDCGAMFTHGQKMRMHAYLGKKGPRNKLIDKEYKDCGKNVVSDRSVSVPSEVIRLYPNPATEEISIEVAYSDPNQIIHIGYEIYNSTGKVILSGQLQQKNTIKIKEWPTGIYYLLTKIDSKNYTKTFEVVR